MKMYTNFLLSSKDTSFLPLNKKQISSFNYVEFQDKNIVSNDEVYLSKQKSDSAVLTIDSQSYSEIGELKITNQDIKTWDDLWIDEETGNSIDPRIKSINLQRNSLIYVNMNLRREVLTRVNLEGNVNLKAFIGTDLPKLEYLNLSDCANLEVLELGFSKNLQVLSLKNCRLTNIGLEKILSSFIPTVCSSANIFPGSLPPFRKNYSTMLDLRGNEITWSNRRIASKIRLLLTNNWMVLWDNPPPTSVIPIQMYAFFSHHISEAQINQYYRGNQIPQIQPPSAPPAQTDVDPSVRAPQPISQPPSALPPPPAAPAASPTPAPQPQPSPSPAPQPQPSPSPAPQPQPSPPPPPPPPPPPSPPPYSPPPPPPPPSPSPPPPPPSPSPGYY